MLWDLTTIYSQFFTLLYGFSGIEDATLYSCILVILYMAEELLNYKKNSRSVYILYHVAFERLEENVD